MKGTVVLGTCAALFLVVFSLSLFSQGAEKEIMPFGEKADVEFAEKLWKAMKGYQNWAMRTDVYPGKAPHGAFLRNYYNIVNVAGKSYHVIVKDNFGGQGATLESVSASPATHLAAVTVMLQREAGYDPDNNDWFWAKYKADGTIDMNSEGMALAGRVAKGTDVGCIACHADAEGGDLFFTNDKAE